VNFWQVAVSGTIDKNGQVLTYSSHDTDAPGFKGKFGIGRSSFIKERPIYTATGGDFLRQAWCRDLLAVVNRTLLTGAASIPKGADCEVAVGLIKSALKASPPTEDKTAALDKQVVGQLDAIASTLTMDQQSAECSSLKDQPTFYQYCPAQLYKSVEEQRKKYPELYTRIVFGQPSKFQWKAWGS